jgi:hypothetical protein
LILPYGSSFPLEQWPQIRTFIRRGGNLVVLGGAPFHQPVLRNNQLGRRQPTWAHELLIGPADEITIGADWTVMTPDESWTHPIPGATKVWALTLRLARETAMPGEHGSDGPREGIVRGLVYLARGGLPRAAPLVEIDRVHGPEKGARWLFAPSNAVLDATMIRLIVQRAMQGARHVAVNPVHATVEAGERPRIKVSLPVSVTVRTPNGRIVEKREATAGVFELSPQPPGLYFVDVATRDGVRATTGFWVRDESLLVNSPKLSVSRDWIRANGNVLPVVGTTYMASDVHRQFLFEPNPQVWDRDFAAMKALGINMVRTGLWTAWSRAMDDRGVPNESFLRALDAYVLTAARHGIFVNFTFYAFLPLAHGGTNPYLDPKSLEGQKNLLTTIASRYRGVGWIHYDLINEPSYAPPTGLWANRPIRDEHEKNAWRLWVRNRYGTDLTKLRSIWGDRSEDPLELPREDELWYSPLRDDRRPRKTRDFIEFTNDVVALWASTLRGWLREAGGDVLVTLGQDEGGTQHRPSQQLHAEAIDYTGLHPWWQNDDVLANGVFIKVPEKPSLFQETGIMRLEDLDGTHWRTPEAAASLLDRKFANAFAARAAGNIQWAWNINPYMPIDNESVIGFFRPDGTAKPEVDVVSKHADFFRIAAPWLDDFELDPVVIVIPQTRLFMNRPMALDGYRRAVRLLAERFGIVPTAISDLRLTPQRLRSAKLVIVPSVEFLGAEAAEVLKTASNVLYLGAVTREHARPVQFREENATFDRNLQESLLRSTEPRTEWREPLPLEYAREDEPLVALLLRKLASAGVEMHPSDTGVVARLLYAPRAIFGVFVNDGTTDAVRRITINGKPIEVPVPGGGSRLMLWDRATGRLIVESR